MIKRILALGLAGIISCGLLAGENPATQPDVRIIKRGPAKQTRSSTPREMMTLPGMTDAKLYEEIKKNIERTSPLSKVYKELRTAASQASTQQRSNASATQPEKARIFGTQATTQPARKASSGVEGRTRWFLNEISFIASEYDEKFRGFEYVAGRNGYETLTFNLESGFKVKIIDTAGTNYVDDILLGLPGSEIRLTKEEGKRKIFHTRGREPVSEVTEGYSFWFSWAEMMLNHKRKEYQKYIPFKEITDKIDSKERMKNY